MTNSIPFGTHPDGSTVQRICLQAGALRAELLSYGATLHVLEAPLPEGGRRDVVLGFDRFEDYYSPRGFYGCTIGRYSNRIRGGQFSLGGKSYQVGDPEWNALHGGPDGFDRRNWRVVSYSETEVIFALHSPEGDQGFPGAMDVTAHYTLTPEGLECAYAAQVTEACPVSLTNHAYFNLAGAGDVLGHRVWVDADFAHISGPDGVPPHGPVPVEGTAMDFRTPAQFGARIEEPQIAYRGGYDHNYCLNGTGFRKVAWVEAGGLRMSTWTDLPGMQLYSGNNMGAGPAGKAGRVHARRHGFCVEPQFWPDSPNHPDYPDCIATPERPHRARFAWRFD